MSLSSTAPPDDRAAHQAAFSSSSPSAASAAAGDESEPILCRHCGRTASNGISCEGHCVADSGY